MFWLWLFCICVWLCLVIVCSVFVGVCLCCAYVGFVRDCCKPVLNVCASWSLCV